MAKIVLYRVTRAHDGLHDFGRRRKPGLSGVEAYKWTTLLRFQDVHLSATILCNSMVWSILPSGVVSEHVLELRLIED